MISVTNCLAFGHTTMHIPTTNGNMLEKKLFLYYIYITML